MGLNTMFLQHKVRLKTDFDCLVSQYLLYEEQLLDMGYLNRLNLMIARTYFYEILPH